MPLTGVFNRGGRARVDENDARLGRNQLLAEELNNVMLGFNNY